MGVSPRREDAAERHGGDDARVRGRAQQVHREPREHERRVEIDVELELDGLDGTLVKPLGRGHASVVDEHVDAPMLGRDGRKDALDIGALA